MFLVTPEFSVRAEDVIKVYPLSTEDLARTVVVVKNHFGSTPDRERTSLSYTEVLELLAYVLKSN